MSDELRLRDNPWLDDQTREREWARLETSELEAALDQAVGMANDHAAEIVGLVAERDEAVKLLRACRASRPRHTATTASADALDRALDALLSRRLPPPKKPGKAA